MTKLAISRAKLLLRLDVARKNGIGLRHLLPRERRRMDEAVGSGGRHSSP